MRERHHQSPIGPVPHQLRRDGNHKLLSKFRILNVVFSPDGRRLRLDVSDPQTDSTTIWEVLAAAAGAVLHRHYSYAGAPPSADRVPGSVPDSLIQKARFPEGFLW